MNLLILVIGLILLAIVFSLNKMIGGALLILLIFGIWLNAKKKGLL